MVESARPLLHRRRGRERRGGQLEHGAREPQRADPGRLERAGASGGPPPTWYGHSVGRIDGDTLVIDTVGFNDRFWFDFAGHPHTEQLHTLERYRRTDLGVALLRRRPRRLLRAARQELLDPSKAWWGGRRGRLADRRCCPISVSLGVVPLVLARFVEVPVRIEVAAGS